VALVALVAVGGLLVAPQAVVAWSIVIGVAAGASLSLSFVLLSTRAKNHETASALSGMVQSIGYLVAATGPVLFGVVRDATGQWAPAFLVLLGMLGAQAIAGLVVGRPDVVLSSRDPCPFPGGRRDRR
jgi:MFS transporter, CP family, cyanate transporter